jgi:hypothetical protein
MVYCIDTKNGTIVMWFQDDDVLDVQYNNFYEFLIDELNDVIEKYKPRCRNMEGQGKVPEEAVHLKAMWHSKRYGKELSMRRLENCVKKGLSVNEAKRQAQIWLDTQAVLHNPDQIAGGRATEIGGLGDKRFNSSIGAQWRYRIDAVDEFIKQLSEGMTDFERINAYLNLRLIF